jgi:hypothetical protein
MGNLVTGMSARYSIENLPPEELMVNGRTWHREKFDTDSYQWIRPMNADEYDWNPEEDDVKLQGTDVPIRAVTIQFRNGEWQVQGAETAGPSYHRPGFTELISSEFSASFDEPGEAFDAVEEFIERLS